MQTISYTYMRNHLAEVMEKIAQGEEICFTRRGHEPLVIARVRKPSQQELEESNRAARLKKIKTLKAYHEPSLKVLSDN